ncbi:peptidyl-prolyl cis-trans isomerase [Deltaproteobacteria bacterium TL4]
MTEKINLTLPERKSTQAKPSPGMGILLSAILLISSLTLVLTLLPHISRPKMSNNTSLEPEGYKTLALKLENQNLPQPAAVIWKEYLEQTPLDKQEEAKIWYRLGKLYQSAESYENALTAYYRSESLASLADIQTDLNRRIQESLELLGKFAALRYELADRVGLSEADQQKGQEILAEIGESKITKSEVDQRVEKQIELQLSSLASYLPQEQLATQKESLLKRYSTGPERGQLLNQMVLEEILYRKAREDKLIEAPEVRSLIKATERGILAQQVLNKAVKDYIHISADDVKNYYEANKSQFTEAGKAQISHILVKDQATAYEVLKQLNEGSLFEELVPQYSMDEATKNKGGLIEGWITQGGTVPGINAPTVSEVIFNTEKTQVAMRPIQSERGFHIIKVRERQSGTQQTLEQAQSKAYQALRTQKEREVQQSLISELRARYNVVIHNSKTQETPVVSDPVK